MNRTPQDFAIEHAEYMAQDAERLIAAINAAAEITARIDDGGYTTQAEFDADGDALDQANELITEQLGSLKSGVYEFRKRRDRAVASTGQPPAEPMFWVRLLRAGLYEGPVHHNSAEGKMMREAKPDEWHPLYLHPEGTAPKAEPMSWNAGNTAAPDIGALLRDPVAVHASMLHGTIATISMEQCAHLHGEVMLRRWREFERGDASPAAAAGPSDAEIDALIKDEWGEMRGAPLMRHRQFAMSILKKWGALSAPATQVAPINMVLHCPKCGLQHIDAAEPPITVLEDILRANPLAMPAPQRWTNGVHAVTTKGKADSPIAPGAAPQPAAQQEPVAWLLEGQQVVEFERREYHDGDEWTPLYKAPHHEAPVAQGDAEDAARLDFLDKAHAGCVRLDDRAGLVPKYAYWGPHQEANSARAAIDAARSQQEGKSHGR